MAAMQAAVAPNPELGSHGAGEEDRVALPQGDDVRARLTEIEKGGIGEQEIARLRSEETRLEREIKTTRDRSEDSR